jgi:hypothetical protein
MMIGVVPNDKLVSVDWMTAIISANETHDLTDPKAWTMSNMVSNPGTTLGTELHELLGASFRVDRTVQKGMLGMTPPELDERTALVMGMGGVRWFEGWPIRHQDSRGSGKVRTACMAYKEFGLLVPSLGVHPINVSPRSPSLSSECSLLLSPAPFPVR